jgi:hypothetical protein
MASYVKILKHIRQSSQVIFTTFRKEVLNIDRMNISAIEFVDASRLRSVDYDFADVLLQNMQGLEN